MVRARQDSTETPRGSHLRAAGILLLAALLAACGIAPEPVHIGSDECAQCRMTISEPQFATQVLSDRGRSYKFDSIECMVAFLDGGQLAVADLHSAWIADFDAPENWVPAEEAFFVHSPVLRSPMGGGLSGHGTRTGAEALIAELGSGDVMGWEELRSRQVRHQHPADHAASAAAAVRREGTDVG